MATAAYQSDNLEVRGFAPRQAEALAYTFEGLTAKEAARAMGVSPRTVEMYLTLAMGRLGARNKLHLLNRAIDAGVLVIKRSTRAVTYTLVCMLTLALVPAASAPEDLTRLPARSVRVRRNREDLLSLIDTLEDNNA